MIFDPERWARLDDLFHRAEELDADERSAFLSRECPDDPEVRAEVEALLGSRADESLPAADAVERSLMRMAQSDVPSLLGRKIGAYRLTRELGRGGMGVVYLGVREDGDFAQEAAIKVLPGALHDSEARWRFRNERRILADLQHPGIARLVDGGETDEGLPYVIMDYVDGVPIDTYCDEAGLSTRARIELFMQVCAAVSHAHGHLVVHRDIKPANILVTEGGTLALLDFGIAKLLGPDPGTDLTQPGVRALTPRYASPEQLSGSAVSAVSDVYSLGVLLYELLAGQPPLDVSGASHAEVARIVGTRVPTAPSVSGNRPELAGDVDTIVLKALEKEPRRRYASVDLFAADLQRYLDGHPVLARPATLRYRAGKFVQRNTGGVAAAGLFVGLLIAFGVTVTLQARRIAIERDIAQDERASAEAVVGFLVDIFDSNNPNTSRGVELTAGEILSRGGARVRESLEDQPAIRSEVFETIGVLYRGLGEHDSAGVFLEEALDLRQADGGEFDPSYIDTQNNLALLYEARGEYEEARSLFTEVLAKREAQFGPDAVEVAAALWELGRFKQTQGEIDMVPLYERAIRIREAAPDTDEAEVLKVLNGLAAALRREGRPDSALVVMERALDAQVEINGEEHLSVAAALNSLGAIHYTSGRFDEAEGLFRESLAMRERLVGVTHPLVLTAKNNLALTLTNTDALEESERLFREIIQTRQDRGDAPATYSRPLHNLGLLLNRMERPAEAIETFTESIAVRRQALGDRHPEVVFPLIGLAIARGNVGDVEGAEDAFLEALDIRIEAFGEAHRLVALDHYAYGNFLAGQERRSEANAQFERTLTIQREVLEPGHKDLGETLATLGRVRMEDGDLAGARTALTESLTILEGTGSRALDDVRDWLADLGAEGSEPPA